MCTLRRDDLLLTPGTIRAALAGAGMDGGLAGHMPNGAIRWRAESDKQGFLFVSLISAAARVELDLYLMSSPERDDAASSSPSPSDPTKPIRRETAMHWLAKAEPLAELPKLRGGAFHPYRRLWTTERKHLPDVDVAAAGGWRDTQALRLSYKHADPATVLRAVERR